MDNLVKLLDADAEDAARLAGLRAIHALATRQGEILRHRVGCRACVDAVWRQLQPFERVVEPTEEEVAAAEEAGAPKPEATKRMVSPSNRIVFHALRCLATMASSDWESTHLVVGAPEGVVELARDLTPLCDILKPDSEVGKVDLIRAKATRLIRVCMRTRIGRECLLRRGGLVPSLLEALAPVAKYEDADADAGADAGADEGAEGEEGDGAGPKDPVLEHAMVCGDLLVKLACASTQTALELVEEHGVVETFHALLRRHDADSRACGAVGLKKFAKFSERAAREMVWRGVMDDIRAMLPTCDRYRTPPTTPLAMEKDNILADAFGVGAGDEARAKKVDLEALLSSRRKSSKKDDEAEGGVVYDGPAVPNMGEPPPPPPPFVPKADTPRVVAEVMELLGALLCHSFVADQFIGRVGGDVNKRGLLPSGKHRPTWTTTITHQCAPAATYAPPPPPPPPPVMVRKLDEEGNPVQATDEEGNPIVDDEGEPVYEMVEEKPETEETEGVEEPEPEPEPESEPVAKAEVEHDDMLEEYRPVLIEGDAPCDDFLACSASLRCLEHAARHPRCRAELLEDDGAHCKRLAAIVRCNMPHCAEPALRILLGIMTWAKHEGPNATGPNSFKDLREAHGRVRGGQGGALAAVKAAKAAREAEEREAEGGARAYDILRCEEVRGAVMGADLGPEGSVMHGSLRSAASHALAGYELTAILPPPPPPAPVPGMEVTARAPLPNHKTAPLLETIEKQTLGREMAERDEMREPFFDQVLTIKERLALRYRQTRGHRTSRSGSVKDPNELEEVVTET